MVIYNGAVIQYSFEKLLSTARRRCYTRRCMHVDEVVLIIKMANYYSESNKCKNMPVAPKINIEYIECNGTQETGNGDN